MRPDYAIQNDYIGTGLLATYSFDFKIQTLEHLLVLVLDDEGNEYQRVRGDDTSYLLSVDFDALDGEGDVTLSAVLPTDYEIFLILDPAEPTQPYKFRGANQFNLRDLESALDWQAGSVQALRNLYERTFRVGLSEDLDAFDVSMPEGLADNPGALLGVNSDGDGLALYTGVFPDDVLVSAFMETLLDDADAASARTTLGFAGAGGTAQAANIENDAIITSKILASNVTAAKLENNLAFPGTAGITLAGGTTAQRPSHALGIVRKNSTRTKVEFSENSVWWQITSAFRSPGNVFNLGLSGSGDEIFITSGESGISLSTSSDVPAHIAIANTTTPGKTSVFSFTSNSGYSSALDGAHFGLDGGGDRTDYLLSYYLVNDNGTTKACISPIPGLKFIDSTQCDATAANCTTLSTIRSVGTISAGVWPCLEVGWFKANFSDAANTWDIQTGVGDINMGPRPEHYKNPWTPSGTFIANTTYTGHWWKEGKKFCCDVKLAFGGAPTSTTLVLNLPVTIDTGADQILDTTADDGYLGECVVVDTGTNRFKGPVVYASSTTVKPRTMNSSAVEANITQAAPMTFANTDKLFMSFKVPAVGWS